MKARHGQVAVYLVLVLVAIAIFMLMNVGAFLAVRAKNRMMNAIDESTIAVARHQGGLLNELGRLNVKHLRSLIVGFDETWTEEDEAEMRYIAMFRPLEAIELSQKIAADWGFEGGEEDDVLLDELRAHLGEILNDYCGNPDLYPEAFEGQWRTYAARLEEALNKGLTVCPAYMETANAWSQEPLLCEAFYDAIDTGIRIGKWCWFRLGGRSRYFNWDSSSMLRPEFATPRVQENSEIYSLHVTFRTWMDSAWANEYVTGAGFSDRWTNFVCQVTGCTREQLRLSPAVADPSVVWAFYDDRWDRWSRTFNPEEYPLAGSVKPEYDVAGCSASCIMRGRVPRLLGRDGESDRIVDAYATAKPFGTVETAEEGLLPVTAFNSFIAPSHPDERIFTEAQLVVMYSVPHDPGIGLSPEWYRHVKDHLPLYFTQGPDGGNGCRYCRLLSRWEDPALRAKGREWLVTDGESCEVGSGPGREKGGYDWGN